jgi:HEAT repeat protein
VATSPSHTLSLVTQSSQHKGRDIQDFVVGRPVTASDSRASDPAMRQLVVEQLLAAMSGADAAERDWAREIFSSQGFLDETISKLRTADAAAERAAAAYTLGITGSRLATAHLVAGLFDNAPEVCQAAAEALARIDDPAVAVDPLKLLRSFSSDQATMDRLTVEAGSPFGAEPVSATKQHAEVIDQPEASAPYRTEHALVAMSQDFSDVPPDIAANLQSSIPERRIEGLNQLARSGAEAAFKLITNSFADLCPDVRNAAAHALYELEPGCAAESFGRAIEEASSDRRRNIGAALHSSGLAHKAIDELVSDTRQSAYNALCLLFAMAKTGEIQPLIQAIEEHRSVEVRCAAVRLLTLNGQSELAAEAAKRRLMGRR